MKWLALSFCMTCIMPLSAYLRRNPLQSPKVWMLIGFLPFAIQYFHLYMAVDSTPGWSGYVKGAEISVLDLIAIALYFTTVSSRQSLPFRFVMAFYFLMVLLSAFQALQPMESLFYSWQLARMFLVYAVVARGCSNPRVTPAIMTGMAAGLIMEAGYALWQRFGLGMLQTPGTAASQNLLGLMSHFVILPFFALLLAGRRGPLPAIVMLTGAVVVVSTVSRGAIGIESLGLASIFVLSSVRKWTSWKARILAMGVIALAVVVPIAMSSFQDRFAAVSLAEHGYDERDAYIKAAGMMLSDHPLGIGANQFAVIGNVERYYERAGVQTYFLALAGNVHNFYYLTAAEIGYQGLIALLLLLGSPLIVAFRCGWRNRGDERGDLLLGLGVALLAVYIHSWVEWVLVSFSAQYFLAITMGLIAGNAQQLGYWSSVRRIGVIRAQSNQLEPAVQSAKSFVANPRRVK